MKQADTLARFKDERDSIVRETTERVMHTVETAVQRHVRETVHVPQVVPASPKVRSITEAASRKQAVQEKGTHEIDTVIWPLLNSGLSVRAIAAKANTSTATVGRSRKRWEVAHSTIPTSHETHAPPIRTEHEAPRETEERVL